jgi:hypothetical protein
MASVVELRFWSVIEKGRWSVDEAIDEVLRMESYMVMFSDLTVVLAVYSVETVHCRTGGKAVSTP